VRPINFGNVDTSSKGLFGLAVNNTGNEDVQLVLSFSAGGPGFSVPNMVVAPPGGGVILPMVFSPGGASPYSATVSVGASTVQGHVLCQPLPSTTIQLAGNGVGGDGFIIAEPPDVDFASSPCDGNTSQGVSVPVYNFAPVQTTLTLTLSQGTQFLLPEPQVPLPAGFPVPTQVVLPIVQQPIPKVATTALHGYDDVLTLSAPNIQPRRIFLHATARGAVLSFNEPQAVFPPTPVMQPTTANGTFYVLNTGNAPANNMMLALTDGTDFGAPGTLSIAPGAPFKVTATFAPQTKFMNPLSTKVQLQNPAMNLLCAPLPTPLMLMGNGM
jgi:hypothetical protein